MKSGKSSRVHVRPVAGRFLPALDVECSRPTRKLHPLGAKFRIYAKEGISANPYSSSTACATGRISGANTVPRRTGVTSILICVLPNCTISRVAAWMP